MLPDLPGVFADREPLPFAPRVSASSIVGAAFAPVVETLGASDSVLVPITLTIGETNAAGLEATYALTVGAAAATVDAHAHDANDATAIGLDDAGGHTEQLHDQVRPYLPPVDTPIPSDFSDTPQPPAGPHHDPDEPPDSGNI